MQQEKRKTWVVSRQGSGFSKEYGGRVDLILNSFKKLRAVDGNRCHRGRRRRQPRWQHPACGRVLLRLRRKQEA